MKEKSLLCFLLVLSLVSLQAFGQNTTNKQSTHGTTSQGAIKAKWTAKTFDHKVFIENRGQFDNLINTNTKIYFGAQLGDDMFAYFTANGVVFRKIVYPTLAEAAKEKTEKPDYDPDKEDIHPVITYLTSQWQGSNANVNVAAEDRHTDYYTYPTGPRSSVKVNVYNKIVYHNLYPGIDAVYTFVKNKTGFKYSLIVHPGADLSAVKLKYLDAKNMEKTADGNIVITSNVDSIIDYAPVSSYETGGSVGSSYNLAGNEESFSTGSGYDKSKTLVVDPIVWTSTPSFTNTKAYDVDYDNAGNVYIYGSSSTWQLEKFDNTGTLQWTYNATLLSTGYYGDFACDRLSGKCFMTEGFNSSGMDAVEVDNTGAQLATSKCGATMQEGWRDVWDACKGLILIGGGGWSSPCSQAGTLDTNMVITPVNSLAATPAQTGHDIVFVCIDPNNTNCYMGTTQSLGDPSAFDNQIVSLPIPSLSPAAYFASDGYTFQESNVAQYVGSSTANGLNGMAASPNWLYLYDGETLKQLNKGTGVIVNSTVIGGKPEWWGGLDVDNCDNLYLGMQDSLFTLDASLNITSKTPMAGPVYDLVLGSSGILYVCGKGFVSQVSIPIINKTILRSYTSPSSCSACDGKATAVMSCGGVPPYTYTWSNGTTGEKDSNLCAGYYTVTITDAACPPNKDTLVILVPGKAGYFTTTIDTNPDCGLSKGNITAYPTGGSSPYTYTWSNGETTQKDTGLVAGTYTLIVTDAGGCKYSTITTLVDPTPPTIKTVPSNDSVCIGSSVNLTASGGKTYTWSPSGSLSCNNCANPTATPTVTTTYTVTGTDSIGCIGTATITVKVNPLPTLKVAPPNDTICMGDTALLTVSGASTYSWVPVASVKCPTCASTIATPTVTTTYTITGTSASGCTNTVNVTIAVEPKPTGSITVKPASDTICAGDSALLVASGGTSYVWKNNGKTNDSIWVKPGTTTTYTVQLSNASGCTATASMVVHVISSGTPKLTVAQDSLCPGDSTALTAAGGKSYKWLPPLSSTNSKITVKPNTTTTYSVVITNPCRVDTLSKTVYVIPIPVISLSGKTTICTGSGTTLTASGGTSYSWTPSGSLSCNTCPNPTASPTVTTTYTVQVSNGRCSSDTTITVTVIDKPVINLTTPPEVCVGNSVILTANGGGTYLWSNGATTSSITVSPDSATWYTVVVNNGCVDSAKAKVVVDNPNLAACCNSTIAMGDTVTIHAYGNGTDYTWAPPDGLSCTNCPNPIASPTVTTTYTVTSIDSNGCVVSRTVTVTLECNDFDVPNVFTPNDDGRNDDFVIKIDNYTTYSIIIYDRWGKKVYSSNDPGQYWNGKINGTQYLVPDGVYFYVIKATCGTNNYLKKGFVHVISEK